MKSIRGSKALVADLTTPELRESPEVVAEEHAHGDQWIDEEKTRGWKEGLGGENAA